MRLASLGRSAHSLLNTSTYRFAARFFFAVPEAGRPLGGRFRRSSSDAIGGLPPGVGVQLLGGALGGPPEPGGPPGPPVGGREGMPCPPGPEGDAVDVGGMLLLPAGRTEDGRLAGDAVLARGGGGGAAAAAEGFSAPLTSHRLSSGS